MKKAFIHPTISFTLSAEKKRCHLMRMIIKCESYCCKGKIISLYGQLLCELSGKMIIKLFGNCTGGVCKEILPGWLKVVIAVMALQLTEVIGETQRASVTIMVGIRNIKQREG